MTPRITKGKGITGAVNYARGEGRDPVTRELNKLAPGEQSRVEFFGGGGFGFEIRSEADIELARKVMEFDALNQRGKCQQDCVHLSLSWRPGEEPTREHMEEQVKSALAAIGMGNAKHLYFSHGDEDYRHIHVVASRINPETGRPYDLKGDYLQLSTWAQQYEAAHGGVISVTRALNNELRAAIDGRDAAAVLEAMTKQRATFTAAQLETALAKQIKDQEQRDGFTAAILSHESVVALADEQSNWRYSTRAVLEAEQYVWRAAESLKADATHSLGERQRANILGSDLYRGMTAEQACAFAHVTAAEGLALIDGQAGTGKSYTIAAVRVAYEAAGCRVIGLGPTNPVAEDMKGDGFKEASTIHSQLFALNNGRDKWNAKTVVIVDEAAMIDTKLMAMVTAHAADAGSKLILVGDDRQLSSINHGGMFGALKDHFGTAGLSEVKRQYKHDERRASEMMAEGNFHDALHIYDAKGAIHWTRTQGEARAQLVETWARDSAAKPDKSRFVLAFTNDDVDQLNAALRGIRKQRGELGDDHQMKTAHGVAAFAVGDRLQFTGTDKKQGIHNGRAGTVVAIDGTHLAVSMDGRTTKTINFDAANFDKFRHGYAGTVYKAQGKTLDQTYLYHSEHWRNAASYVALTRHRDSTALFVATNTAKDVRALARQMSRTDERRAASVFTHAAKIDAPARTAGEILARLSATPAKTHLEQGSDTETDEQLARRKRRHPEREDMDEDLAAKQRQQRQQIEDREAATYNDMVADKNRADRFLQEWQISHDQGERNKKSLQEQLFRRDVEDGITDVRVRALLAAGESRDFVQAVRVEGAMITREHLDLQRQIGLEADPDKKQMLEFRRDIQHADYMALANERVAAMSNLNSEQYKEAMRQQEEWQKTGTELRKERLELQDRMAERDVEEINADFARRMNEADRQRAAHRDDIRGPANDHQPMPEERAQQEAYAGARGRRDEIGPLPETAAEPVQRDEAWAGGIAPAPAETRASEAERPAEVAYSTPARPLEQEAAAETTTRENSDARQVESSTAEHAEITDAKAAKLAAWAKQHTQTEQAIESGRDRGNGRDM